MYGMTGAYVNVCVIVESRIERESPRGRVVLTGIRLDLTERSIAFEAGAEVVGKLTLAPEGILFEAPPPAGSFLEPGAAAEVVTGELVDDETPTTTAGEDRPEQPEPGEQSPRTELEGRVTLAGRLKTTPREGKPDRRGNPTAWARFAAHVEGEDGPHLYSATFHRHTAAIALTLEKDAPITVDGYAHPSRDPAGTRLDTLSVVNLVAYPGKGKRAAE